MNSNIVDVGLADELNLNIVCDNAYELALHNKEEFIMLRKNSLGASDSSIILGVNPFTDTSKLIEQKCATSVTPEFMEWSGLNPYKPNAMYQLKDYPQLTVNFDGIICLENVYIPVEAKFVSMYAHKYWNTSKAIKMPHEGFPIRCAGRSIPAHVAESAELYGIPPYYYTQIQQQLLALRAPFGYLAALFDKGWELKVFKIFADPPTQQAIIDISSTVWETIAERKPTI